MRHLLSIIALSLFISFISLSSRADNFNDRSLRNVPSGSSIIVLKDIPIMANQKSMHFGPLESEPGKPDCVIHFTQNATYDRVIRKGTKIKTRSFSHDFYLESPVHKKTWSKDIEKIVCSTYSSDADPLVILVSGEPTVAQFHRIFNGTLQLNPKSKWNSWSCVCSESNCCN